MSDGLLVSGAWCLSKYLVDRGYLDSSASKVSINIGDEGLLFGLNVKYQQLNLELFQQIHIFAVVALIFCFYKAGLYQSFRGHSRLGDLSAIVRGITYFCLPAWFLTSLDPAWREHWGFSLFFILATFVFVSLFRFVERMTLKWIRSKGYNQRHLLVVGAGRQAQDLVYRIQKCRWMGFHVVGYVSDDLDQVGKMFLNVPVIGTLDQVKELSVEHKVDQVYCALTFKDMDKTFEISRALEQTTVDFRIVPDLVSLCTLNTSLFDIDGLPVLGVRETPLQGFGVLQKRVFDMLFSLSTLLILSPLMGLIAILIKCTSKGPIFFFQERVGYDGRAFKIIKFRSMVSQAEEQSGPVWATKGDNRTTKFGAFLRKTSLDELPQFFNVLMGSMSVVGPRPERPEFITNFKEDIPKYMLRHKTKAGLTGWAQVNGWRGSTSLKKRIQYDLYYIENWSIWFDMRIVIDTVFRGFVNKNAY